MEVAVLAPGEASCFGIRTAPHLLRRFSYGTLSCTRLFLRLCEALWVRSLMDDTYTSSHCRTASESAESRHDRPSSMHGISGRVAWQLSLPPVTIRELCRRMGSNALNNY
ncbi:hypothetical protein TNCV_2687771 [Trichonephila clavipes]|nr:hypothetical protein TNCV_2687771 [Trichonephila clavipes]